MPRGAAMPLLPLHEVVDDAHARIVQRHGRVLHERVPPRLKTVAHHVLLVSHDDALRVAPHLHLVAQNLTNRWSTSKITSIQQNKKIINKI